MIGGRPVNAFEPEDWYKLKLFYNETVIGLLWIGGVAIFIGLYLLMLLLILCAGVGMLIIQWIFP